MFNHENTQQITENNIDERCLPSTGIISLKKLYKYSDGWAFGAKQINEIAAECERFGIPVFKPSDDTNSWLISLEHLAQMENKDDMPKPYTP